MRNISLKQFAVDCYNLSSKELFTTCLELYEKILEFPEENKELETIRESSTFEVDANDDGYTSKYSYNFYLEHLKNHVPNAVAILSEIPKELGLYTWEIVTVDERLVENKLLKVWIVPKAIE